MSEVFKQRVEPSQTPEIAPQAPIEQISEDVPVGAVKAGDEPNLTDNNIEIWEGLHNRKYGEDYFKIRELSHTFPIKAEFSYIDKFVKAEMSERSMETTVENYENILREIEQEIGTEFQEPYSRINRIFQYIKTLSKYRELKAKKESFRHIYD